MGGNTWQWGRCTRWMYDYVTAYANDTIGGLWRACRKLIDDHLVDENVAAAGERPFNPHAAVSGQVSKFAADALGTIGEMILWSPLDPAPRARADGATGQAGAEQVATAGP